MPVTPSGVLASKLRRPAKALSVNAPGSSNALGIVMVAGAVAIANEVVFAPATVAELGGAAVNPAASASAGIKFNWRIIPATIILGLTLEGLDKVSPGFGKGLAGLALLAVLVTPVGNARTPVENVAGFVTGLNKSGV